MDGGKIFFLRGSICFDVIAVGGLDFCILFYIGKLFSVYTRIFFRLAVSEYPGSHPNKSERTDKNECSFPSIFFGECGNKERSYKRTYLRTGIKYACGKSTVFLRKYSAVALMEQGKFPPSPNERIHRAATNSHTLTDVIAKAAPDMSLTA